MEKLQKTNRYLINCSYYNSIKVTIIFDYLYTKLIKFFMLTLDLYV